MKPGVDYIGVSVPFYCNDGKGNFVFHKKSKRCRDEQGKWDTGAGEINFGETVEEGVLRELKEEYGCKGKIQEQLPPHSILRKQKGKNTHWLVIPFFILVDPKKVKIKEPHKIDEIGWFKLNNLPKPLHTGFQFSFKKYKKSFDKYK